MHRFYPTPAQGAKSDRLLEPLGGSPGTFAKLVHDDSAKYAKLASELNIRIN